MNEYQKREDPKDLVFKARFYSKPQLREKQETIVKIMQRGQVTVSRLNNAIKENLRHAILIWNPCNFYIVAASDDLEKLHSFMGLLGPSCIHDEFEY